jgi:alpha-galactosidase
MIRPDSIYITINGKRDNLDDLPGLKLTVHEITFHRDSANIFELRLKNIGLIPLEVTAVELIFNRAPFFREKADAYSFYKEGLTVVGVAGSRGKDDCDFELDPNFLRFTVSDPSTYSWKRKGVFCAEQIGLLQDMRTGECLLAGFVTAEKYLCKIMMDMKKTQLSAIIDTEQTILPPDSEITLEKLMIASGDDLESLLNSYAQETASHMKARKYPTIPTGWCSYYYYYGQETESDILENARFLSQHRDSMPVEYIQIDDGWQKARGNWLESHPDKFPHGMEWLATGIKKLGFKPGIWVAPFLVSENTEVYQQNKEWLLRDSQGELLAMGDNYFLDSSHPDALAWLSKCFKTMKSWGYTYFKLDFMMVETCDGAKYHDKNITRIQAYRRGLEAIRKALGEDAFILGGTVLVSPSVGLVDGCRVSTDVTPFWCVAGFTPESPAILNVCRNIINRGYMHRRLWLNDPDCLIVREYHNRKKYDHLPSLTLEEIRMLATTMIMSGGALFLGDRLETLSEERLEIIRKVFSLMNGTPAWPLDRMSNEIPKIWIRSGKGSKENPHLLAIFNWYTSPDKVRVKIADLKLDSARKHICEEVWTEKQMPNLLNNSYFEISLASHTCKLISIYTGD